MKKLTFNMKALVCAGAALLTAACVQSLDKETFQSTTNEQLESPAQESVTIEPIANADGSESIVFSWGVVPGAGGYQVSVYEMDGDASEVRATPNVVNVLIDNERIDGCSVTFPKYDDTYYLITVLTLGNDKLNNKEALEPMNFAYKTWAPMTTLPSGSDLASVITLVEPEDPDLGQGFELVAGGQYTLSTSVDFGLYNVTLKGDETNPPTVEVQNDAMLITQAGLKIKNINFDCTASTASTLIGLSTEPDPSISLDALGYKAAGASFDGYLIEKPVIFDGCMVKNLPAALLNSQATPWSLRDVRVVNSIIQLNNDGTALFEFANSSNCLIKELTINGCTLYSTKDINANFINYPRQLDANQIYGNDATASIRFENSTFAKFSKKQMGNNSKDTKTNIHYITNSIFYDCFRLYQIFGRNNGVRNVENNILYYNVVSLDSNDTPRFGEVEDPGFTEPFGDIDFSLPNGGLNFTPTSGTLAPTIGDPRWR